MKSVKFFYTQGKKGKKDGFDVIFSCYNKHETVVKNDNRNLKLFTPAYGILHFSYIVNLKNCQVNSTP